jgi:CxxC-x17-CxxC domain-containing protein
MSQVVETMTAFATCAHIGCITQIPYEPTATHRPVYCPTHMRVIAARYNINPDDKKTHLWFKIWPTSTVKQVNLDV